VVPGDCRGALARLVIGVGVEGNDRSGHRPSQPQITDR
jgi:hypothetical protein